MRSNRPKPPAPSNESQRLNKVIAASGLCSRRAADELILAGKVAVNGRLVVELGISVRPFRDKVTVDGHPLDRPDLDYVLLNKPKGVITSCEDEKNRSCVLDLLPEELHHLKPVGRLDRDSMGLVIMTNDGPLIHALTHPSKEIGKTYRVTVPSKVTARQLRNLAEGVELEEGPTRPAQVTVLSSLKDETVLEFIIFEGRNRQIRRMCNQVGLTVKRLVRVAFGALQLSGLKPGGWRHLTPVEIKKLRQVNQSTTGSRIDAPSTRTNHT